MLRNKQIEFHTLINSVTEEELNGNRWLINTSKTRKEAVNVEVLFCQ